MGVSVAVVGGTISDGAAKSHFIVVQTSCLHKIWLQAGRLHYNIWIITVLFSLFAASSVIKDGSHPFTVSLPLTLSRGKREFYPGHGAADARAFGTNFKNILPGTGKIRL